VPKPDPQICAAYELAEDVFYFMQDWRPRGDYGGDARVVCINAGLVVVCSMLKNIDCPDCRASAKADLREMFPKMLDTISDDDGVPCHDLN
jgi:hypothetical protein